MPKKPETERKFLIRKPSLSYLLSLHGAAATLIVQTYLLSAPGVTARVRRREGSGGVSYTATEKRRLSAMTAMEDERELSESEYRALLLRADPTLRPVEKTRVTLPHGDLLLEIDLYPFWERTAVLEVELPSEDTSFAFPPYLTLLREVTGELAYKNVSLAARIPPEE